MGARSQLSAALKAAVDEVEVIPDLGGVTSIDPQLRGLLQVVRTEVRPATQERYLSDFELWVVVDDQNPQTAEDPLDDLLDDVVLALATFGWLTWEKATRDIHPTLNKPAYRLTLTTSLKGV